MIDGLVGRGLLDRTFRDGNRKQVYLKLTDDGLKLYTRTRKLARDRISERLAEMAEKEKAAMERGLEALRDALVEEKS
jgi:DNA-binding MarR family transcriptional regulator